MTPTAQSTEFGNSSVQIIHGDALDLLRDVKSSSVSVVLADPPYGINTKSDGNGKLSPWADLCNSALWYSAWISECRRILKSDGCLWSFLNWRSMVTFQKTSCDLRWPIESLLVWDKCWIGPGGSKGLRPSYEMVALWAMPEFAIPDRGLPDVIRVPWSSSKPNGHPAEKPLELAINLIEWSSKPSDLILDPFLGSGTTPVACIKSDRKFLGFEIDEGWYKASCRRVRESETPLFAPIDSISSPN